jgi:hypothetical protein
MGVIAVFCFMLNMLLLRHSWNSDFVIFGLSSLSSEDYLVLLGFLPFAFALEFLKWMFSGRIARKICGAHTNFGQLLEKEHRDSLILVCILTVVSFAYLWGGFVLDLRFLFNSIFE